MDENQYLELKGLIIDWATEEGQPEVTPEEVAKMLERIIGDFRKE